MFLTKILINRPRRGAKKLLGSPQAMHAAVAACFMTKPPVGPDGARVLWRADELDNARAVVYIASPVKPDPTSLVEQAGWPETEGSAMVRPYGTLLDSLASGQRWAFRLRANPTRCIQKPAKYRADEQVEAAEGRRPRLTKRFGHVTMAYQQQWLLDRAAKHGFEVSRNASMPGPDGEPSLNLVLHDRDQRNFSRADEGKRSQVVLTTATYDGLLTITDPVAFRRMLVAGLGPAKGYGCGLMTLARAA